MSRLKLINPPGSEKLYESWHFSQAVVAGDRVEVSGQVGLAPDLSIPEDITEQARLAFTNLKNILEAAGSDLEHVMHLTQYFTDANDMAAIERVFTEFFKVNYPARTAVRVAGLALPNLKLELQATAALKDEVSF